MEMEARSYSRDAYRYGFNGQEKDDEVKGSGNSIAFEYRIYDSRIGRFLSRDPWEYKYTWQSTYVFAHNSPVTFIDWKGLGDGPPRSPKDGDNWTDDHGNTYKFDAEIGNWTHLYTQLEEAVVRVQGKGFFGKLWENIKSGGEKVGDGLARGANRAWAFSFGLFNAVSSDITLGEGRLESTDIYLNGSIEASDFQEGQFFGDYIALIIGAAETLGGLETTIAGGIAIPETGPIGAGIALEGLGYMTHGVTVIRTAFINISPKPILKVEGENNRIVNPQRSDSPQWKKLENAGGGRKKSGKGKKTQYYEWDNTHNDIEVYDNRGNHLGTMDPVSGEMIKPRVPGRTITIN